MPLHLAALYHQATAIVWLITVGGADVLAGDKTGRTPLQLAQNNLVTTAHVRDAPSPFAHNKGAMIDAIAVLRGFDSLVCVFNGNCVSCSAWVLDF